MPARFLLIDGYNLLHAAGMGRVEYGPGDLKRCRERLLRYLLAKLTAAERERATVVFDARDPPPDRPARLNFRGLTVLFANPLGDADVTIQDWLDCHSAPKRVTLISSDRVLQRAARRRGAEFVASEQYFERLEHRHSRPAGSRSSGHDKPGDQLSPADAERWSKFFGDLSSVVAAASAVSDSDQAEIKPEKAARRQTRASSKAAPGAKRRKSSGGVRKSKKPPAKRGAPVSSDDVALWMELFGDLPEAAELRRGGPISQAALEKWLADEKN